MREKVRDISSARNSAKNNVPPGAMTPRRLAAIVAGDISGYSRLMQVDEEGTHARVKRIQRDLIEPTIAEHHGRLVKTTGDGFFAIFDSPVEAVRCGVVIQQNMLGRNASLPLDQRIEYRIGVNLGDVIIEEDDIYGDGVNIASRLESITEPGQVFISGGINKARKRRETILIFLLSFVLLAIAGSALWHWLPQRNGKADQASTHVLPDVPRTIPGKQSAQPPQPSPSAAPATKEATRENRPAVSAPPAPKQMPSQPQLAATGAPGSQPAAVREPEMNMLRGGTFMMGSNDDSSEKPVHQVTIKPFAISRYPISVREWNECAAAKACTFVATDGDDAPITNVSWSDARQFVGWLAGVTHKPYRLPTEAEWEYAARGGTQTKYWWGNELLPGMANCKGCTDVAEQPTRVGSFKPNPFGLYDMGGAIDQWVEDCWHKNYGSAPTDGSAWMENDCGSHVIRSGSWKNDARYVRPANRDSYDTSVRYPTHGFRVALSL
jgi:formylglycine-generating enzyme required for sulfatase activity